MHWEKGGDLQNFVLGGMIGLAVGDAFGVPVEFLPREQVRRIHLQDMVGCDTGLHFTSRWGGIIPRGAWSDDTSMTVAAAASIAENAGHIDYEDIMRRFEAWWDEGLYASLDVPFGLGGCVNRALNRHRSGIPALRCGGAGDRDNGNGSLMRIFPFSALAIVNGLSDSETAEMIGNASGITHAHDISRMSCFIYTQFLGGCYLTKNPALAYQHICKESRDDFRQYYRQFYSGGAVEALEGVRAITPDGINESGYVADSLKTAIYSILHTKTYEDAVKMAVDFGYDTDTNAAITGSIAGALYGCPHIPDRWLSALRKREYLETLSKRFADCAVWES